MVFSNKIFPRRQVTLKNIKLHRENTSRKKGVKKWLPWTVP